jgi:glycyl-tRNA synthetase
MSLEETSCSTRKIELSRQYVLILCHLSMFGQQIAPRQGPMRVREFTLAEIEHFVNPYDKSHPKFKDVAHLEFFLFPRAEQTGLKDHVKTCIGDAVAKGIVDNETLGYFIARTYLFLTGIGINKERLRFRQHLQNEMAHYAQDCWDAEIECSYGWFECVGLADRSAFDLKAHTVLSTLHSFSASQLIQDPAIALVNIFSSSCEAMLCYKQR